MTARTAVRWTAGAVLCAALGLLVGVLGHREVCVTVTAPAKPATPAAEIGQPLSRIPQATRGCTQPSGLPLGVLSGGGALLLLGAAALPGPRRRRGPHAAPDPGGPQRDELVASVLYAIDRASSPAVAARLAQDLERVGVRPVGEVGETFDPAVHEAVSTVPAEDGAGGVVSSVDEHGYADGERLIRPARVVVTRAGS